MPLPSTLDPAPAWPVGRGSAALLSLTLLLGAVPTTADAQVRRGRAVQTAPQWAPPSLGLHFGLDQEVQNAEVVGVHARIPILRNGRVELGPSAALIFPIGEREYQYDLDVRLVPAVGQGGAVIGAGLAWRKSSIGTDPGDPLAGYFGYNAFVGGRTPLARVDIEFVLRWTFLNDTDFQPNLVAIGLSVPFWRARPRPPGA